jgi:hypothetical protein
MEEQLQHQRFERKYFITERQAMQIREFVKYYLVPDKFSEAKPDLSYPVHSIYLDSESLLTYWATVHCEKRRFKLRVRFYDNDPEAPLFFEIKRRENECVLKQRGLVRRSAGASLLAGHLPGPEHLAKNKPHYLAALQRFCYLIHQLNARPMVHVGYRREAWVGKVGNSVRVTIDRGVCGEPWHKALFHTQMVNPVYPFGGQSVLELKFTDRFPDWFNELVRRFDLVQTGVPKYCGSVAKAGEKQVLTASERSVQQKLAQIMDYC